jgi:hypothetical protein
MEDAQPDEDGEQTDVPSESESNISVNEFADTMRMPLTMIKKGRNQERRMEDEGEEGATLNHFTPPEPVGCVVCLRLISTEIMTKQFPRWWNQPWVYRQEEITVCPRCCHGQCIECGAPAWFHSNYVWSPGPLLCGQDGCVCGMEGLELISSGDRRWRSIQYTVARIAIERERMRGITATPPHRQRRWLERIQSDLELSVEYDYTDILEAGARSARIPRSAWGGFDQLLERVVRELYGEQPRAIPACLYHVPLPRPVDMWEFHLI